MHFTKISDISLISTLRRSETVNSSCYRRASRKKYLSFLSYKNCYEKMLRISIFQMCLVSLQLILNPFQSTDSIVISGSSVRFNQFSKFILESQQEIIKQLEDEDGKAQFCQDNWQKGESGYGITAVLQRGDLLEKAACSTTIVTGILSEERAKSISGRGNMDMKDAVGKPYFAAAISLVLHSKSPMVPTFRSDVRYFEVGDGVGWFGGGADLTPYYLYFEDAENFHKMYKDVCDVSTPGTYEKCKKWCDDYFFLPARGEHRGIGGIFFDDLSSMQTFQYPNLEVEKKVEKRVQKEVEQEVEKKGESISSTSGQDGEENLEGNKRKLHQIDADLDNAMEFTQSVCSSFMPSYLPIARKRRNIPYTEEQRHWQLLRRGRYIEFNLLYDRGVKFGLVPGGRIEAVMVSCPPLVAWDYNHVPLKGSTEESLMQILKNPKEWC